MPPESSLQDLARMGDLVRAAVVLATCAAAVAVGVVLSIVAVSRLVHPPPLHKRRGGVRWRMRHPAARAFAAAVADGDLERLGEATEANALIPAASSSSRAAISPVTQRRLSARNLV